MNRELLEQELIRDEGLRLFPYEDTVGKITIGVGRNLTDKGLTRNELSSLGLNINLNKEQVISVLLERGLTKQECLMLLSNDIDDAWDDLTTALPWVEQKPEVVQRVLTNMNFNVGLSRLLDFKKTLAHIKANRYLEASQEMLNSRWANQVGARAIRLSNLIKSLSE